MNETKDKICCTLFYLMKSKKLDDISIKEIYINAKISRTTLDRNFKNVDKILIYYFDKVKMIYYKSSNDSNILTNATSYLTFLLENKEFIKKLSINNKLYIVYNDIYKNVKDTLNFTKSKFYISCLSYAFYGLIKEWIKSDFSPAPKKLLNDIYDIDQRLIKIANAIITSNN